MILTPGFTRSSQPWMFFGLPLRTTSTTTDWVRIPLVGVLFHVAATCLLSTRRCTSGSREKCTTSACRPPSTARLWSPEAPYEVSKATFFPSDVLFQSAITCLFACSRIEQPTRLSAPMADATTAAFHFLFTFMRMRVTRSCSWAVSGVNGGSKSSRLLGFTGLPSAFHVLGRRRVASHTVLAPDPAPASGPSLVLTPHGRSM